MKHIVNQFVLLFIFKLSLAQQPVLDSIHTIGDILHACNEPAVLISQKEPNTLFIATNTKHLFRSKNRGKTNEHQLAESRYGVYGDPVLIRNQAGDFFYIHLAKAPNKQWPECFDRIVVQKSQDDGKTWTDGVGIGFNGKMQDKPWASFDRHKQSPYHGQMYVSWTEFDAYNSKRPTDSSRILLSVSANQSETFSEPVRISDRGGNCLDDNATVEGATTASLPDGRIICVWAGHENLYMDISADGGKTWGQDRIIDTLPGGWNLKVPGYPRNNALPFVSVDAQGRITVVTCRIWQQLAITTVYESQDAGKTWTTTQFPAELNEAHMMPIISQEVQSGLTGILYYTVSPKGTQVKLAWRNSAETAWQHQIVNAAPFPPPGKGMFFGDYLGLDVLGKNMQAIWTEVTPKGTRVFTRRIEFP